MILKQATVLLKYGVIGVLSLNCLTSVVQAQEATKTQLQTLIPNESDLQGFVRVRPAGELPDGWAPNVWSPKTQTITVPVSPAIPLNDEIDLNTGGSVSTIQRRFYSQNGLYQLDIEIKICDTPEDAAKSLTEYLKSCQSPFNQGSFGGSTSIGDESWVLHSGAGTSNVLVCRAGKTVVLVVGDVSASAARHQFKAEFPIPAVEAVAYQALLKSADQPELTGVFAKQARLTINKNTLPIGALKVAGHLYVPVTEFAKAMGLTSHWDTKTGALSLSGTGHKTVALTAGSTAATVGDVKSAALSVPVLKQAGQPVMTLDDLLTLTGGKITGRSGDTVQVKS